MEQLGHGGGPCGEERGQALAADGTEIGAVGEEQGGDAELIAVDGATQGRFAKTVAGFDVGATIQQGLGNLGVAAARGHVEGCAVLNAGVGIDGGAGSHQGEDHLPSTGYGALIRHGVERRVAASVLTVGVRAKGQEQFDDRQISAGRARIGRW